ncbi:prephenate dehydrogenase [Holzapfeliella floricola]|uniref:Prephenate dehydrogenase n=2 Tax=Holzapfeliella TaxID=2767883 RepID=A0A0R2DVZ3_9LACO|nr:prephenate dehydrogenase/arogenate dehydrogenase family protein [Holzapfeliella floricola]KRN04796.1 prephenate dehydrogenase [Holzapfeliella floricola DSM 23037 = JCM 16512]
METVFISGMGLIGSSIARIIRQKNKAIKLLAEDVKATNTDYLLKEGLIDEIVAFEQGVKAADFVFLATPVSIIKQQLQQLGDLPLSSKTIVTDVGSTKLSIMAVAKKAIQKNKQLRFIGGHPMSGSHLTGSQNGHVHLFKEAFYFLINQNGSDDEIKQLTSLLSESCSRFTRLSAEEHDQLVGITSHLPHLLATTLVNTATKELKDQTMGLETAANGFKKTTEIAQADEVMWQAIFLENKAIIADQINHFQAELEQLKQAILSDDQATVINQIKQAKLTRQSL